ncbi:MAG: hypothetical protein OEZ39_19750 [Gammaproteobacteria bacterium]|nr:hypothetical protein [Gammaproteobacteria bacterium]MDH5654102.1 hypothetical protein [Gammaproteobacteria bacterium]
MRIFPAVFLLCILTLPVQALEAYCPRSDEMKAQRISEQAYTRQALNKSFRFLLGSIDESWQAAVKNGSSARPEDKKNFRQKLSQKIAAVNQLLDNRHNWKDEKSSRKTRQLLSTKADELQLLIANEGFWSTRSFVDDLNRRIKGGILRSILESELRYRPAAQRKLIRQQISNDPFCAFIKSTVLVSP